LLLSWLATLLLLGAPCSETHAQSTLPGNSVGVFFDPQGVSHTRQVLVGVPFFLYVITNRPLENLYAFELAVQVDPRLRVLSRTADPQSDDILEGDDQWAVSFRSRCLPSSDLIVLLTYQVIADAPAADLSICVVGSTPSSLDPPAPAHIGCPELTPAIAFIPAYAGCAQVAAATVADATSGWGAIKARYRRND
jgi:hypothetical protein